MQSRGNAIGRIVGGEKVGSHGSGPAEKAEDGDDGDDGEKGHSILCFIQLVVGAHLAPPPPVLGPKSLGLFSPPHPKRATRVTQAPGFTSMCLLGPQWPLLPAVDLGF